MLAEKVEANKRIRETQIELGLGDRDRLPFLCECADVQCRALIRLTVSEYTEARSSDQRCVVIEGHRYEGRVVKAGEGYLLAEE